MYLIGSADLMPRNLDRRVEVLVPIDHPKHREWLDQVLEFDLADDIVRWELRPDDSWERDAARATVRAGRAGADVPLDGRAPATVASLTIDAICSPSESPFTIRPARLAT